MKDQYASRSAIQSKFLDEISALLPPNIGLVHELSEILNISIDSAYRRIRGETHLTIDEAATLCEHFKISFDSLINSEQQIISFSYDPYSTEIESFEHYFQSIGQDLEKIRAVSAVKHITYLGHNIPILRYFNSPLLAQFKLFYWMNIMKSGGSAKERKFDANCLSERLLTTSRQIFTDYMHVPSTEVWTDSTVQGVIKQINFYWNTGMFQTKDIALHVCQELLALLESIEAQAEAGRKFIETNTGRVEAAEYSFYYSEFEFENTCIHVRVGDHQAVYLGHLSHRYIKTTSRVYADTISAWYGNIKKRSNLLSQSADAMRYQFFKRCYDQVAALKRHIEVS